MKTVLPEDEYPHEPGPEPTHNESMYFNLYDPERRVGGFLRLADRPNEGRGERTVCLYLPDGTVAFDFARPESFGTTFAAAGMSVEVVEPFQKIVVRYRGEATLLADPDQMNDPKTAFAQNPRVPCLVDLTYRGISPAYAHNFDGEGQSFAPHHYEQLVAVTGSARVAEEEFRLEGFGLRDHSWGPRSWQAPWYYRWLIGTFDDGFGFMGAYFGDRDGSARQGGFVWENGVLHHCDEIELTTTWTEVGEYHTGIDLTLRADDREWHAQGRVMNRIPLRNRKRDEQGDLLLTCITEGLTRWETPDGRIGHGLTEYLDQIVNGRPVGRAFKRP